MQVIISGADEKLGGSEFFGISSAIAGAQPREDVTAIEDAYRFLWWWQTRASGSERPCLKIIGSFDLMNGFFDLIAMNIAGDGRDM